MGKVLDEIALLILENRKQSVAYDEALKSFDEIIEGFKKMIETSLTENLTFTLAIYKQAWASLANMLDCEDISYECLESGDPDFYLITAYIKPKTLEKAISKVIKK